VDAAQLREEAAEVNRQRNAVKAELIRMYELAASRTSAGIAPWS